MITSILMAVIGAAFAVASLLLLLLLIDVLVRRADITAALLIGSTLMDAFFANAVPSVTLPGDIRVGSTDIIATAVLCAAFARLLRMQRLSTYHRWLVLFIILLVLSLARGILTFGVQTSVSDFRLMEFWIAAAVYFATVPPSHLIYSRIAKLWIWMTVPLMVIVLLRWLDVFAGIQLGVPRERFGSDAAIRVVDGPYTFFLAQGFILTLPFWRQDQRSRAMRLVGILLLVFVVLLDRRTAWVALLAGIVTVMIHDRRIGRRHHHPGRRHRRILHIAASNDIGRADRASCLQHCIGGVAHRGMGGLAYAMGGIASELVHRRALRRQFPPTG
jgi:hypothetical protein